MPVLTTDSPVKLITTFTATFDSITNDEIILSASMGNLISAWSPYCDYLFGIQVGSSVYFFHWNEIACVNGKTQLAYLQWYLGQFTPIAAGTYTVNVYKDNKIPVYNTTMCTIGDSITWKWWGSWLRALLIEKGLPCDFVGKHTDIFGYKHSAEGGNKTEDVLVNINEIPFSDNYCLLLGINDYANPPEDAFNNILRIEQLISVRSNRHAIFNICTLLPNTNETLDTFSYAVNQQLLWHKWPSNVRILDLGGYVRALPNWQQWMFLSDGTHPSLAGYKKIAGWLAKHLCVKAV